MILHVKEAKYLHDYVIWVRFNDSIEGEVDLENELEGEVFGSLKDKRKFKFFKVKPILKPSFGKMARPCPEFLHENLRIIARRKKGSEPFFGSL